MGVPAGRQMGEILNLSLIHIWLDRPVEGLVLYAKNSKSAAALTRQITQGEVDKCYYAVVKVTEMCIRDRLQPRLMLIYLQ